MRNPNRTTKPERRFIRRYNPYAARILGVAEAARWHREGILLDEAKGFDNILDDLKYGIVPFDLNDRVNAAIDGQRHAIEARLGAPPGAFTPTNSNVNHHSGTHTGYEVSTGPNPHITLKYPPHISLGPVGAAAAESLAAAWEAEPLGPSECGHYEVVETTIGMDAIALTPETIERLGLGGGTVVNMGAEESPLFAAWQAYRAGRDAADDVIGFTDTTDPSGYEDWDGNPWRDPGEVDALHAEVIENALNDDINPGE